MLLAMLDETIVRDEDGTASCFWCFNVFAINPKVKEGDTVTCPDCGDEYILIDKKPIKIYFPYYEFKCPNCRGTTRVHETEPATVECILCDMVFEVAGWEMGDAYGE
jgi:ribosomal protein S27E